jgi:formate--tetrahydrofolate ligase
MTHMNLDPRSMPEWEIAAAAEERAKPISRVAAGLGLRGDELIPYGSKLAKVDYQKVLARLGAAPTARYIDITAITPTPLGEGKTTTTIGLIEGLGHLGHRVCGAIRQPSSAPTFNIKGSAAGGGLAQCVPMTPISIRLTGDLDCVTNAHNLAMVALTARMQHERNYDDTRLAQSGLQRLDIDPQRVQIGWAIDFCAQALRRIRIGLGGKMDGVEMDSGFQMTVASEVMAILAVARDLEDLRERIARMVVAYSRSGREVTTADLGVDGAMTAWMVDAINPTLVQTIEGQPVFIHAGPFANIAIGQSSIIADRLGTKLADYHVTESGFAADIGYEKFWNLKCRMSGLRPDAVVIVATIRALKMHGGGPPVKPGLPLDPAYTSENVALVEKGCENLVAHIEIVRQSGVRPIVCLNRFHTDTEAEIRAVRRVAEAQGARAVTSSHWLHGGAGAVELTEAVLETCREKNDFHFLYDLTLPLHQRIDLIAREVYGADGVTYTDHARAKLDALEAASLGRTLGTCMAKTQLSLSHDPDRKGRPRGWTLPIHDILVYKGAGFVVPVAGQIKLMPGTGSDPAFRRIDVDVHTGRVKGLF